MNKIYVFCVCMHINITHIIDKTPKTCFPYVEKKQSPYNSHFKVKTHLRGRSGSGFRLWLDE